MVFFLCFSFSFLLKGQAASFFLLLTCLRCRPSFFRHLRGAREEGNAGDLSSSFFLSGGIRPACFLSACDPPDATHVASSEDLFAFLLSFSLFDECYRHVALFFFLSRRSAARVAVPPPYHGHGRALAAGWLAPYRCNSISSPFFLSWSDVFFPSLGGKGTRAFFLRTSQRPLRAFRFFPLFFSFRERGTASSSFPPALGGETLPFQILMIGL